MRTWTCRTVLWGILFSFVLTPVEGRTQQTSAEENPLTLDETEDLKTSDMVPVTWFQPRRSGDTEIVFMGKTLPSTKLYLLNPYIVRVVGEKERQVFLEEDQVINLPSQASEDGVFNFQLKLDKEGRYLADVVFIHPEDIYQKSTSYRLTFEMKNDSLSLWAAEVNTEEKVDPAGVEKNLASVGIKLFPDYKNWVTLSLGTTLLSYHKESEDIPMDAKVSSTQNSFFQIRYDRVWKDDLIVSSEFSHSSGKVSSGPSVQVVDGEYRWMRLKAALQYYPKKFILRNTPFRQNRGALIGGLTYESLPYLRSVNQYAEQEMAEAQFMTLYLGSRFDFRRHKDWKWWSQFLLHSPPFTLGSSYEIRGSLSVDLSIGADYVLPDRRWSIGTQFDINWRNLTSFEKDVFVGQEIEADQEFFTFAGGVKVIHAF